MSITKDFDFEDPGQVTTLLNHARALEAMLEKHSIGMGGLCRECGRGEWHHAPDCQLAKLLEGVE